MRSQVQPQHKPSRAPQVTEKSKMPCFEGNEMPFPFGFSGGFSTPWPMERCFRTAQGEGSDLLLHLRARARRCFA